MARKDLRYISGDTNPVITGPVPANNRIEIGDLVSTTPAALSTSAQASLFLGVSGQRSDVGDVAPIRVSTSGDYEHPCVPNTFNVGDLVGISSRGVLAKTNDPALAIGRAVQHYATATSSVVWRVLSRAMSPVG